MRATRFSTLLWLVINLTMAHAQTPPAPDAQLTNAIRMAEARLRAERRDLPPADLARLAETLGRSNWLASQLVQHIATGDFTNATLLLKEFPGTVNDLNQYGHTLLYRAVTERKEPQVRFLLEHRADPNLAPQHGQSPLQHALQIRAWDIATLLVRAGASPTLTNRHHGSAAREFFQSWYRGGGDETNRIAFLQQMLQHGFDPFEPMETGQDPPVSHLEYFFQRFARYDMNFAFIANSRFPGFRPAPATTSPGPNLCDLLLTNRPDANRRTPSGETALHLAACWNQTNALAFLLAAGFNVDHTNAAGLTALQALAGMSANSQSTATNGIAWLLAHDANVNLFTAAGLGLTNRVAELLQADPALANARDSFGRTPLHYAIHAVPPLMGVGFTWLNPGWRVTARPGLAVPPPFTNPPPQLFVAELLLQRGADPSAATTRTVRQINPTTEHLPAGSTPLHLAAQRGHPALLRPLLAAKAGVAAADEHGDTPLHLAARTWQSNSVHYLLLARAPIEATNRAGHTPLRGAVEAGLTASAAQLIAAGASLTNGVGDTTLLHLAARTHGAETTRLLRRHGLALDARDGAGRTPFFRALETRQWPNLTYLRREGANLNAADHDGNTPLHFIAAEQHDQVNHPEEQSWWLTWQREQMQAPGWRGKTMNWIYSTKLLKRPPPPAWTNTSLTLWLIQHGAQVNATNRAGQTPLHAMLSQSWVQYESFSRWTNRLTALLDAGARLDARDTNGFTPLTTAVAANASPALMTVLLRRAGGDLNAPDASGRTLLHTAIENARHYNGRVSELLALGLDPNATNRAGLTPLLFVLSLNENDWQRDQLLQILLTNGANPNLPAPDGNTPLHYVMRGYASNQNYQLRAPLTQLLAHGANPNLTNHAGQTPLHLFAQTTHPFAHPGEHLKPWMDPARWNFALPDREGNTPVHLWAKNLQNCWNCVEFFTSAVTNNHLANATNRAGSTPLHLALQARREHLARALMQCGADPLRTNSSGATAYRLAIENSTGYPLDQDVRPPGAEQSFFNAIQIARHDPRSLEAWLAADPTLHSVTNGAGLTPLLAATAHNNTTLANRLLDLGASLDPLSALRLGRMDDFRHLLARRPTPPPDDWLFEAVRLGQLKAMELLVTAGGNVRAVDGDGHSLLFRANAGNKDELVVWLRQQQCRTTFFDLVIAGDVEAARAAITADTNLVNAPNPNGRPPLLRAAAVGQTEMVALLLKHGANRDAVTVLNWNALHVAAANDSADIARRLLNAGLKPDQLTQNTLAPLHIAAAHGHTNVMRVLLEHGASPSLVPPNNGSWGHTPLHWAAHRGHVEAARLLLAHGADVKALNARNETPLELARRSTQGSFMGLAAPPEARAGYVVRRAPAENYATIIQLLEQAAAKTAPNQ